MKIGILSMQRVINNGSLLQAYGLKRTIELLGNELQFVDYKISDNDSENTSFGNHLRKSHFYVHMLLSIIKNLFKGGLNDVKLAISNNLNYRKFTNEYLNVLNLSPKPNYSANVDVLVFGSDEVFNTTQYVEVGIGHAWQLYGADNQAKKLVSYAASFGHTTYEKLEKYNMVDKASFYLRRFASFSVRDKNSFDIIKSLTGIEANINIDPVLLYDFSDIDIKKPKLENYILVYAYPGRINCSEEIESVRAFAKKHNKKLVCVNMMQTWCDEMIYAHPFDLLGYFKYADYVVTDTFHGAVISIKYNVPFIQFIRDSSTYSNNQKVGYLLQSFGLEDRILKNLDEFEKCLCEHIDYTKVNKKIDIERERSMNYLRQALKLD